MFFTDCSVEEIDLRNLENKGSIIQNKEKVLKASRQEKKKYLQRQRDQLEWISQQKLSKQDNGVT